MSLRARPSLLLPTALGISAWLQDAAGSPVPPPIALNQRILNINHTRAQPVSSGVVFQYQICNARTESQQACFVFDCTLPFKHLCAARRSLPSELASMLCSCPYRTELGKKFSKIDCSSAFFPEGFALLVNASHNSVFTAAEFSKPCVCNPSTSDLGTQQIH